MATAQVARPAEHPIKKKPFANFIRKLGIKTNDSEKQKSGKKSNGGIALKNKKSVKNNPYPQSGNLQPQEQASQPSFGDSPRQTYDSSFASLPACAGQDREGPSNSNKSGAPTLATNPETVNSDAGQSRAATTTTGAGALSSIDGAGANSTFSSPNQSDRSLATTLTTIQSQNTLANQIGSGNNYAHHSNNQPIGSAFSHQYPVSPSAASVLAGTASAIPRHLHNDSNTPNTYNSATANNLLSDNASILTLASSSKRRRRSMDTDASVRALAPNSVFGGSRESLPLSVLSSNVQGDAPRHSYSGLTGTAAAERASVYSSSGLRENMVSPVPPSSERNSYYAKPGGADTKSLRSITNLKDDARSITGIYPRSELDNRSLNTSDVASLRSMDAKYNAESSHHGRNGSIPGSIGTPANTPSLLRQASTGGGTVLSLSRGDSDWRDGDDEEPTAVEEEHQTNERKHD